MRNVRSSSFVCAAAAAIVALSGASRADAAAKTWEIGGVTLGQPAAEAEASLKGRYRAVETVRKMPDHVANVCHRDAPPQRREACPELARRKFGETVHQIVGEDRVAGATHATVSTHAATTGFGRNLVWQITFHQQFPAGTDERSLLAAVIEKYGPPNTTRDGRPAWETPRTEQGRRLLEVVTYEGNGVVTLRLAASDSAIRHAETDNKIRAGEELAREGAVQVAPPPPPIRPRF